MLAAHSSVQYRELVALGCGTQIITQIFIYLMRGCSIPLLTFSGLSGVTGLLQKTLSIAALSHFLHYLFCIVFFRGKPVCSLLPMPQ